LDKVKVIKIKPTDRVLRIRQAVIEAKPILCSERALSVTKSYKETEGRHYIYRRAKSLERILEEITLNIWDDELIVGMVEDQHRCFLISP
jgi:formate C-acetyltransferase